MLFLVNARFEVLRKLVMKIRVFWDVMPYNLVKKTAALVTGYTNDGTSVTSTR